MNCPACSGTLTPVNAGNTTLDICLHQCGGIWFDRAELDKFDEHSESIADNIVRAVKNSNAVIDPRKERRCPKCSGQALAKRYHDSQHSVEIDECEACDGIWLDLGELHILRMQDKTTDERNKIVDDYTKTLFGKENLPKGVHAVFKLLF